MKRQNGDRVMDFLWRVAWAAVSFVGLAVVGFWIYYVMWLFSPPLCP